MLSASKCCRLQAVLGLWSLSAARSLSLSLLGGAGSRGAVTPVWGLPESL